MTDLSPAVQCLIDRAARKGLTPTEGARLARAWQQNTATGGPVRPREGVTAAERPGVPTGPGTGDRGASTGDERRERYAAVIQRTWLDHNGDVTYETLADAVMAVADAEIVEALRRMCDPREREITHLRAELEAAKRDRDELIRQRDSIANDTAKALAAADEERPLISMIQEAARQLAERDNENARLRAELDAHETPHTAPDAGLRKEYTRAIHHYDNQHGLSGNDIPSKHHRGEADAVLAVRDRRMERLVSHAADMEQKVIDLGQWQERAEQAEAALARVLRLADFIAAGAPWLSNHQNTANHIRDAANTTTAECRRCHCPADSPQCDHCNCCDVPDQPA